MKRLRFSVWAAFMAVAALQSCSSNDVTGVWGNLCAGGTRNGEFCDSDADCPGDGGCVTEAFEWPDVAVHVVHLHTGKILVWPGHVEDRTQAFVWNYWDPEVDWYASDAFTEAAFTEVHTDNSNMFCAGHAPLTDGRILVAGGDVTGQHVGLVETNIFDPDVFDPHEESEPWTAVQDMHFARWYPTCTTLEDGRILTVSGDHHWCVDQQGGLVDPPEECPDLAHDDECSGGGTCEHVYATVPEVYEAGVGWSRLNSAELCLAFYPFMFLLPDGTVFFAGTEDVVGDHNCRGLNPIPSNQSYVLDMQAPVPTWSQAAVSTAQGGSAVMYEPGKILKSGGNGGAGRTTEVIDMRAVGSKEWVEVGPMHFDRRRHQLTALADGTVLVTGGTSQGNSEHELNVCEGGDNDGEGCNSDAEQEACSDGGGNCVEDHGSAQFWVAEAELFDPKNLPEDLEEVDPEEAGWQTMASATTPRMYHSTAVLLPDGRVLSAGGGQGGGALHNYPNAELYSPPYLFKGPRPTVTEAPKSIQYGDVFEITTPDAPGIDKASLVRLASVTHSFDQNARYVPLSLVDHHGDILEVAAPLSARHAPPGYYMLFLISDDGVPSVAKYIRVDRPGAVWVDFNHPGIELGTFALPFDTLAEGIEAVSPGGILRIKAGSSSGPQPVISKRMTVKSYGGSAVIGQ